MAEVRGSVLKTLHAFSINILCFVSTFSLRGIISNGIFWSGGSMNGSARATLRGGAESHATPAQHSTSKHHICVPPRTIIDMKNEEYRCLNDELIISDI